MKPSKLFLVAIILGAIAASSAIARPASARAHSPNRSFSAARPSATHSVRNDSNWRNHRHHRHHRHSRVYFAFGYPFGYGYPYYGYYPYRYGYYTGSREVVTADRSIVIDVQRRLARNGYYRGPIDGFIGHGTRNAIRSYERAHGLRVDGQIDQRLLASMGLA